MYFHGAAHPAAAHPHISGGSQVAGCAAKVCIVRHGRRRAGARLIRVCVSDEFETDRRNLRHNTPEI